MPIVVGTSGWQYRDWRGPLYPPDLPQHDWLAYYASQYATVENNSTFYRLPARDTFAGWQARIPGDFVMAIKASRYLTHVKRLRDPEEPVAKLMAAAAGLGGRLGPVLLQLPPDLAADPGGWRRAWRRSPHAAPGEPARAGRRGPGRGGAAPPVLVDRGGAAGARRARCRAVLGGPARPSGHAVVADGRRGLSPLPPGRAHPWPRYGPRALRSWLDRLAATWPDEATVYAYFNNDPGGAAVADSAAFAAACRRAGRTVTRTPGAAATPAA